MATFEHRSEEKAGTPSTVERIEVRPWRLAGKSHQEFVIGSGANFDATTNILIEIIYSVNHVQFFYTRSFIHHVEFQFPLTEKAESLEKFKAGEHDGYGFGDMLPETSIILKREKHTYNDGNNEQKTYIDYCLEISADTGAVMGKSAPGQRRINIKIETEEPDEGIDFMRHLTKEIADVFQEKHPDPANLPAGSSDWIFARLVNQKAYDKIALDYAENYFSESLLTKTFDKWLNGIPAGGHILDIGCGHGEPVIAHLLEKGYRVTCADLSPKMLERARENFPDVPFVNQLASEMTYEAEFDGACSLSSMLYLDPIDLSHSIYRLYHALKPNGLLFLHAYDLHPGWRGEPYHVDINQWMWAWTYSMDEAVQALEEHGYFKVLKAQDVTSEEERQTRIEKWYKRAKEEYDAYTKQYPNTRFPVPDPNKVPRLSYKYIIVAQRQTK
jgi:SAM-dependent methyltransferase